MSKKKAFMASYSILTDGKEYPRQLPITGVSNKEAAEIKLRKLCNTTIQITKMEEIK